MTAFLHSRDSRPSIAEGLTRAAKRRILLGLDALSVSLALLLTMALEPPLRPLPGATFAALGAIVLAASAALGLHRIKLNAFDGHLLARAAMAALAAALALRALDMLGTQGLADMALVLFGLTVFVTLILGRLSLLRLYLAMLRWHRPRTPVVIYGAGETGLQLGSALRRHSTIRPVAFIDDNPLLQGMIAGGLRVYPRSELPALVRETDVSRVILAMPGASQPRQARIARDLHAEGLQVQAVPSFAQLIGQEPLAQQLMTVAPKDLLGRTPLDPDPGGKGVYSDRVVMVTGAGGSIGSELCRQLLACKPSLLILFDISEAALYTIDKDLRIDHPAAHILPVLGSVTDARALDEVFAQHCVNAIFHAAAYKHVPLVEANPIAGIENNVLGTHILARAAEQAGVARFVLVSTDKAVRPGNVMGATKRLAELAVQDIGARARRTRFAIVRFGNVLGSSGSVVPLFRDQIARGGPVTLTDARATRYFMTIAEAAQLVLAAGAFQPGRDHPGADVFMLDMGPPRRIRDLAVQMIEAAGFHPRDAANPGGEIEIKVIGLRPGEKLHEELFIGQDLLPTPHPKILRAREAGLASTEMTLILDGLRGAVAARDGTIARRLVFRWVEPGLPGSPCAEPMGAKATVPAET